MRVHWTNEALDQLLGIREQVAKRSPDAADRLVDRLATRAEQLELFPRSGRVVPEYEQDAVREVIVRPYRVIYRVKAEQVDRRALCDSQPPDTSAESIAALLSASLHCVPHVDNELAM